MLTYDCDQFYLDGQPFQIRSAAMHYFRICPEYWQDRLEKIRACGFNCVETYVCWNRHEQEEEQFDFTGILDLPRFLRLAGDLGLKVILRPGPFICAEWAGGGLPYWLLQVPELRIRSMNRAFLQKTENFFRVLFEKIRPYLSANGGPVIMVQVENEYGSYGNDQNYLQSLVDLYRRLDIRELLFTADGPTDLYFRAGSIPGVLATLTFGSHPRENLAFLKQVRPQQPSMCTEYWCGWFDHWHEPHHTRDPREVAADIREFMKEGASFNVYMFCGGTNFGFNSGANSNVGMVYKPTATTYDYNAPIREDGSLTPLYYALQKELAAPVDFPPVTFGEYGRISLTPGPDLAQALPVLSAPVRASSPLTFEEVGLDTGYLLYRTSLRGPLPSISLHLLHVHDRAHIFLDGKLLGILERGRENPPVSISVEEHQTAVLDILVENMGRTNYGYQVLDRKGLTAGAMLEQQYLSGWEMWPLPMDNLDRLPQDSGSSRDLPAFYRGTLSVPGEPKDTFLHPVGLKKGFLTVNGFNLGRYYPAAGPQKSLYLPAPLLHSGDNEILVFETDGFEEGCLESRPFPDLGPESL